MSVSITIEGDWLTAHGATRFTHGSGDLSTYDEGAAVPAHLLGLRSVGDFHIYEIDTDSGIFRWQAIGQ